MVIVILFLYSNFDLKRYSQGLSFDEDIKDVEQRYAEVLKLTEVIES
mgnify:CR=1 FL=1